MSILIEKLILEIKRIKKEYANVKLGLDEDVTLLFFTELFDEQNLSVPSNFTQSLR